MKSNGNTIFVREVFCPQCNRVTKNYLKLWKTQQREDGLYVVILRVCLDCSEGKDNFPPVDFFLKVKLWNELISNP